LRKIPGLVEAFVETILCRTWCQRLSGK